jgi:hypothetical protein
LSGDVSGGGRRRGVVGRAKHLDIYVSIID